MKTLNQFIPLWSTVFRKTPKSIIMSGLNDSKSQISQELHEFGLDLSNHRFCVVGEAFNFTRGVGQYNCEDCRKMGLEIFDVIRGKITFNNFKRKLYNHFKNEHKEEL